MKKVLLGFAEPLAAESVRVVLLHSGAELCVACGEREMIREALSGNYALILTGFIAPFLCGGDLIRQLGEQCPPRPAVFVLSHLRVESNLLALYESGIDQFISFPFAPRRLRHKVEEELDGRL